MNIDDLILDDLLARAGLDGQTCMLNHNDEIERPAVDYLCHQVGYELPEGDYQADAELRIPICEECVQGLCNGKEILFYCIGCGASQWMLKSQSKREYPDGTNIIAMRKCPKCYNELLD